MYMTVIWLALPLERRATLESDAINKQQKVFKICHPPYDEQPRRKGSTGAGEHLVTVYVLRVVRGVHAPSRGTSYSRTPRSEDTRTIAKETMGQSEYLYLVIDLRVATSTTNTES